MNDLSLTSTPDEILSSLDSSSSADEVNEIISLFNVNMKKKNLARMIKLSDVQDKIINQIQKRVDVSADEFNNQDLLKYYDVFQKTLDKVNCDDVQIPTSISIQQNNINMEDASFSRESRERILRAIEALTSENKNTEIIDE